MSARRWRLICAAGTGVCVFGSPEWLPPEASAMSADDGCYGTSGGRPFHGFFGSERLYMGLNGMIPSPESGLKNVLHRLRKPEVHALQQMLWNIREVFLI